MSQRFKFSRSILAAFSVLTFSGCATMAPDSVPWLLHRQQIREAPWWAKPRITVETGGVMSLSQERNKGLLLTPTAQYTLGLPVGNHLGLDLNLGLFPPDMKAALPISTDKFVIYPFCAVVMRDSSLLSKRRWQYDPGLELAYLASPDLALKLTASRMRYDPFTGIGSSSAVPNEAYLDYVSVTAEPILRDASGSFLGQVTMGYGYNSNRGGGMVFLRLSLSASTSPALYRR